MTCSKAAYSVQKEEFILRVFLTGATGFIGSAIVPELINAGHQVLGLTRSDAGAQSLIAAAAEAHRGDLEHLESLDAARLYKLALEKREAGSRYHAVAEEGVPVRNIAGVIGRGLKVPVVSLSPEEAPAHFGWLGAFMGFDLPASSAQTQKRLDWHPTGPGLIADLEQMHYL